MQDTKKSLCDYRRDCPRQKECNLQYYYRGMAYCNKWMTEEVEKMKMEAGGYSGL